MIQTSPIQISDFSGGITDNFIDAPINKYQQADNFLITENKKAFTRGGLGLYSSYPQLPVGNQRVGAIFEFDDNLIAQSGMKFYYDSGTSWEFIGNSLSDITVNNYISHTAFNKQLYVSSDNYSKLSKIYVDDTGSWQTRTAGMPYLSSDPTLAGTSGGGNNYIYAFHYYYEYKVGTVTHIDAGPVTYVNILDMNSPDVNNIAISSIPELTNGTYDSYDVVNIKVKIYRTIANGDVLYLLDTIDNGVTSYIDSTADSTLINNGTLYTTGGVLDNSPPPRSKYIHVVNGIMWYGNVKVGTSILNNRVMQSVVNDPDSVPEGNFTDLDDEITGISSYMDRVLVFCKNSVYRLEGNFDETGVGDILVQKIADTIGCVSNNSIVQTPHGVFFASNNGFAYTDGFKCITISNDFNNRYTSLVQTTTQQQHITGTYDRVNNSIYFAVQQSDSVNGENDKLYICDARWGISENMTFTTFSGDSFNPTSLVFYNDRLVQADFRGYILDYSEDNLSDVRIDVTIDPSQWGTDSIIYNYKSIAIRPFNDRRSFMPKVIFSASNDSNLSVQIISDSDIGNRIREMKPVRWRGNFVWDDPMFEWGDPDFRWGVQGFVEHQRYFFGDDLRCTYKQIQLTNAEATILDSNALSTATVDNSNNTVLLDDLSFSWYDDMLGYSIYFENDNYSRGYPILANSSSTLSVLNSSNLLPSGSFKWVVKGIPKDEILSLLNITIMASPLGQTQDRYDSAQEGDTP